jgi:hypothetical protein
MSVNLGINYSVTFKRNSGALIYPFQGSYAGPDNFASIRDVIQQYFSVQLNSPGSTFNGVTLGADSIRWARVSLIIKEPDGTFFGNRIYRNEFYMQYSLSDWQGDWSKIGPGSALPFPQINFPDLS